MTPTLGVVSMLVRGFLVFCLAVFFIAAVLRGALAVYAIAEGHNGFAEVMAIEGNVGNGYYGTGFEIAVKKGD